MSIPNVCATLRKTSTVERAGSGSMIDSATKIMTKLKCAIEGHRCVVSESA